MGINNHWRNKQLPNSFAQQETYCIDFIKKHSQLSWQWHGLRGKLFDYCSKNFTMSPTGNGLIIVNHPTAVTPKTFVTSINTLITEHTCAVYLAINRFDFVSVNDLNIDYHESLTQSIEQIVEKICLPLKSLGPIGSDIDGKHFVGIHGLDIFTYERDQQLF